MVVWVTTVLPPLMTLFVLTLASVAGVLDLKETSPSMAVDSVKRPAAKSAELSRAV